MSIHLQNPKLTFVYHKLQGQDLHGWLSLLANFLMSKIYDSYFSRLSILLWHFKIPEILPFCWFIPGYWGFLERRVCEGQSLEECPVSWQCEQTACLGLVWWALLVDAVGPRPLAGKKARYNHWNLILIHEKKWNGSKQVKTAFLFVTDLWPQNAIKTHFMLNYKRK